MIKVYSTPTCPWCDRVKEYLNSNSVSFEDIDVAKSEKAASEMIRKTDQRSVPVIDIDGNIIIGFDKESLDSYLGL